MTTESGPKLTVAIGHRYDSRYLRNGIIGVEGFDVDFPVIPSRGEGEGSERMVAPGEPYLTPSGISTAMAADPPYDIGEQAFSTYVQLNEALAQVRQGRGQIVCLIGEAGLGKSRLLEELHQEWIAHSPPGPLWPDHGRRAAKRRKREPLHGTAIRCARTSLLPAPQRLSEPACEQRRQHNEPRAGRAGHRRRSTAYHTSILALAANRRPHRHPL